MLEQIVGYLKFSSSILFEMPRQSAQALANVARISRLFYELAMPLLWEEVHMWEDLNVSPYTLFKYPRTAERVSPYIRTMYLFTGREHKDMSKTMLNRIQKYVSRCLQILTLATSVKTLHLSVHMYNIENHPTEVRTKLEGINNVIFRILRHAEAMELDEFGWHPTREAARSPEALRIVGRKITSMRLSQLHCGDWIDYLNTHERLTSIKVSSSRTEGSIEFDRKFWTTIHQLKNCTNVVTGEIPIPFGWSLEFRNITDLDLTLLFDVGIRNWINTVTSVFKYMPKLETLSISALGSFNFQLALEAMCILDVACKDLKELKMTGYSPGRLLVTIGNQCTKLKSCHFEIGNVNDDDLYALSQYRHLEYFYLHNRNPISNGLTYLTNLRRLKRLDLHYHVGRYMNTQLLLDFARFCPRLNIIHVADYNSDRRQSDPKGPFETEDISELFAAGSELRAYFEPQYKAPSEWTTGGLVEYLIRIDHLRRDKLSSQ